MEHFNDVLRADFQGESAHCFAPQARAQEIACLVEFDGPSDPDSVLLESQYADVLMFSFFQDIFPSSRFLGDVWGVKPGRARTTSYMIDP